METSEVKVRNEFFVSTLFVETSITSYLSKQLNITDAVESEFLGNKPNAVRLEQKIDAVLDSEVLSIIDKSKLSVFKEIYKEFMANPEAATLENSFISSDANDDFLLILYPQSEYLPREEKLTNACYQLIGEVSELVASLDNTPQVKISKRRKITNLDLFKLSRFATLFSLLFILK